MHKLSSLIAAGQTVLLTCVLGFPLSSFGAETGALPKEAPIVLGVSEFASHNVNEPIINATIRTLKNDFGENGIVVKQLKISELRNAVRRKELDLVLSSAGTYRTLVIEGTGLRDLATVSSDLAPNPNYADGSVFFTLASRRDISKLEDLKGKTAAANYPYAFSGWQIALGEILKKGFDPDHFFSKTLFLGHDAYPAVEAVISGKADVGIARACFLENSGLLDKAQIKVIGAKKSDDDFPCLRSTDLYPNWTIATTPNTPPEVSRKVTADLLAMKPIAHNLHWSVATDFTQVDSLFRDLKVGPFEYLRKFDLMRFWQEYWGCFVALGLFIIGLILHSLRANALVIKRTAQLTDSLRRERALAKEAKEIRARMSQIQTSGLLNQMGSMIAHELKQPLATASNYCFTLRRRAESHELPPDLLESALEKINTQLHKASSIIDKVRSYAKGERRRTALDLAKLTQSTLEDVKKSTPSANIELLIRPGTFVTQADEIEYQLVLLNLVNNALDAAAQTKDPVVLVSLSETRDEVCLTVQDNGPRISDEQWERLENNTQRTTKKNGLGFGLRIVKSIVEDAGGRLSFARGDRDGITVSAYFPMTKSE